MGVVRVLISKIDQILFTSLSIVSIYINYLYKYYHHVYTVKQNNPGLNDTEVGFLYIPALIGELISLTIRKSLYDKCLKPTRLRHNNYPGKWYINVAIDLFILHSRTLQVSSTTQ